MSDTIVASRRSLVLVQEKRLGKDAFILMPYCIVENLDAKNGNVISTRTVPNGQALVPGGHIDDVYDEVRTYDKDPYPRNNLNK